MADFADGLFSGINSVLEIRARVDDLKQRKMWNDAAAAAADAMKDQGGTGGASLPAIKDTGAGGKPSDTVNVPASTATAATSLLDDPDLKSIPTPKYMSALKGKTKSATAADAPNYLPKTTPKTKSATAADEMPVVKTPSAAAAFDAADNMTSEPPGGQLGFSSSRGLHTTQPGEPGIASTIGGALGTVGSAIGDLWFSSGTGLYREGSAVAPPTYLPQQQVQPQQALPTAPLTDAFGRPLAGPDTQRMLQERR